MEISKKDIAIVVLVILCVFLFWLRPAPADTADAIIQQRLDSIAADNRRLEAVVRARAEENNHLLKVLDSLEHLSASVEIKYKPIYEKNKTLPATELALEFERVFSENCLD